MKVDYSGLDDKAWCFLYWDFVLDRMGTEIKNVSSGLSWNGGIPYFDTILGHDTQLNMAKRAIFQL